MSRIAPCRASGTRPLLSILTSVLSVFAAGSSCAIADEAATATATVKTTEKARRDWSIGLMAYPHPSARRSQLGKTNPTPVFFAYPVHLWLRFVAQAPPCLGAARSGA